jgi:hypothetical protein
MGSAHEWKIKYGKELCLLVWNGVRSADDGPRSWEQRNVIPNFGLRSNVPQNPYMNLPSTLARRAKRG